MYEEEIDLRPYIQAVIEKWYWIVGTAVIAGIVAFVVSSLVPPTYEAETAVAIIRSRTDVTFDSRIVTEDEAFARDQNARRSALVALVQSTDVIEAVLADVGDQLAPDQRGVAALRRMVNTSSSGDLIQIRVSHGDPQTAAMLANSWGQQYERHINQLYGGNRGEGLAALSAQVQEARSRYDVAQADLEQFTQSNRLAALTLEIASLEAVLADYYDLLASFQANPVQLSHGVLAQHYADLQRIESWLLVAQSLRQQVAAAGNSSGASVANQVSFTALQSQVYGSGFGGPALGEHGANSGSVVDLQIVLSEETAVTPADVDNLIVTLEQRRLDTLAQIEVVENNLPGGESVDVLVGEGEERPFLAATTTLSQQIATLQAELIAQESERDELVEAQRLTWATYQSLTRRQAETEIVAQTMGSEVRVASRSAVPERPVGPGRLLVTIIAVFTAALLSMLVSITLHWWYALPQLDIEQTKS